MMCASWNFSNQEGRATPRRDVPLEEILKKAKNNMFSEIRLLSSLLEFVADDSESRKRKVASEQHLTQVVQSVTKMKPNRQPGTWGTSAYRAWWSLGWSSTIFQMRKFCYFLTLHVEVHIRFVELVCVAQRIILWPEFKLLDVACSKKAFWLFSAFLQR